MRGTAPFREHLQRNFGIPVKEGEIQTCDPPTSAATSCGATSCDRTLPPSSGSLIPPVFTRAWQPQPVNSSRRSGQPMGHSSVPRPSNGKLLIVDDTPETLTLLSEFLGASDYEVLCLTDGAEALGLVQAEQPDLILLDINMPTLNGYEVCQQLKANDATRSIPVIFMSVIDQKHERLQAFAVGGADYITKPFWLEEVLARVNTHVNTYRMQQRLKQQAQRAMLATGQSPLLVELQRMLHRQTERLKEQNDLLQREVRERQMAEKALRVEKHKSEQLLLNILPKAVVEQLKQFQGSLAERFDEATILFADIVNFTPLAAEVTPLELVNLLNQVFSTFDRLAEQYGLEKIKTIGDAYMVVGGVPTHRPDHVEAVMEMAIAMQSVIQDFTQSTGEPLQLRIGINTGAVVAGVIGIKKFTYDLWGDAVNVASRMESQGVPGKIQVTEAIYERLKHQYTFEEQGPVLIKGKGYMSTYHYTGRHSSP